MAEKILTLTQKELRRPTTVCYDDMPFTKIEGFFQEFPWVYNILSQRILKKSNLIFSGYVKQVHVRRVDPPLLTYKLDNAGLVGEIEEDFFLLDEQGKIIKFTKTVLKRRLFPLNLKQVNITVTGKLDCGPTIQSQLQKKFSSVLEEIRYFLSYFLCTRAIILYKIPGNVSLADWVKKEIVQEQENFSKELKAIG